MALKAKYVTLILCQAIGPDINKSKDPRKDIKYVKTNHNWLKSMQT